MDNNRNANSPVIGLFIINNYLIVASGGGGKKFGLRNKLLSYRLSLKGISEVIYEKEIDEMPVFISGLQTHSLFCVCMSNQSLFYSLNDKGEFNEVNKIATLDIKSKEIFQSVCQMSSDGKYFGCGLNNGTLKIYDMKLQQNGVESFLLKIEKSVHIRVINHIVFISHKKIVLTASGDGSCKMFEIDTLKQLAKISFRQSLNESANYFMRDIIYDSYSNVVYTLQSLFRGKTFITKWDLNQNLKPMRTLEVNDKVCFAFSYSQSMGILGITDAEGYLIFVNSKTMSVISKEKIGENLITSSKFFENYLITGSADNFVRINKAKGASIGFFTMLFRLIIIGLVAYYIYLMKYYI